MLKKLNACDYFIIIWALYYLQGVLYPQGIINQMLQLVMILWSGVVAFKYIILPHKSSILKATFLLVFMYCIYGGWIILFGSNVVFYDGNSPMDYTYLQNSLRSLLPIFLFFHYTKGGLLNNKKIIIYTILFLLLSIVQYYKNKYDYLIEFDGEEITNNVAYKFLSLMPLIYFFRNRPFWQYVLLIVIALFVVSGMKRGAILIGGLAMILFLYSNFKAGKRKRKLLILVLSSLIVVGSYYYVSYMMQTSDYFVKRLEQTAEGNSSGRDIIYGSLWRAFQEDQNVLHILFGRGANATIGIAGNYAHQDWLETLINNGVIGTLILFSFFFISLRTVYLKRKLFPPYMYYSFVILICIMFAKTIFSMSIQDLELSQTLLLGYFAYWSTRPKEEVNQHLLKN